jgi:hypothetical protein
MKGLSKMNNTMPMRSVLQRVFSLKKDYAKLPLFEFMRDERRDAADRLSFYPCMAHFILSFGDLNRYVLRREPAPDEYQARVNTHTYEDDHHWPWYLEDYHKLGFDKLTRPTDLMRFLWSDEARQNRLLMHRLATLIEGASGVERIAIIEAIEETGNVLFTDILPLAKTLEARLGVELRYCGNHHFDLESGHASGSEHGEIAAILIDEATHARCLQMVEAVFEAFTAWTDELLRYAHAHTLTLDWRAASEWPDHYPLQATNAAG